MRSFVHNHSLLACPSEKRGPFCKIYVKDYETGRVLLETWQFTGILKKKVGKRGLDKQIIATNMVNINKLASKISNLQTSNKKFFLLIEDMFEGCTYSIHNAEFICNFLCRKKLWNRLYADK